MLEVDFQLVAFDLCDGAVARVWRSHSKQRPHLLIAEIADPREMERAELQMGARGGRVGGPKTRVQLAQRPDPVIASIARRIFACHFLPPQP
jgi:hypothetical protein